MKKNAKAHLIRWIILLQELDLVIHDNKGLRMLSQILVRIVVESVSDSLSVIETFPNEQLMSVSPSTVPWYADILNYHVMEKMPDLWTK